MIRGNGAVLKNEFAFENRTCRTRRKRQPTQRGYYDAGREIGREHDSEKETAATKSSQKKRQVLFVLFRKHC